MARESGFQLVEMVVALAVLTAVLVVGAPPLMGLSADLRLSLAASELVGTLRRARSLALRHNANVAVKLRTGDDGTVTFALHLDGDGDGVTTADIDRGTDLEVEPPRRLAHFGRDVRFGFPPGRPPTDPGDPRRPLDRLDDPIRFNRSDLASFGPLGTATPGSLYVTDGRSRLVAVRVFGTTGKVRVLTWDGDGRRWR